MEWYVGPYQDEVGMERTTVESLLLASKRLSTVVRSIPTSS